MERKSVSPVATDAISIWKSWSILEPFGRINRMRSISSLGSGGTNSLTSDNLTTAQKVIDKSIKQVSQLRGRLGAFQRFTIGSTVNSLGIALENASAAESAIRDTDFAEETANLTRNQILAQAATTVLSQANASPQAALALLQ